MCPRSQASGLRIGDQTRFSCSSSSGSTNASVRSRASPSASAIAAFDWEETSAGMGRPYRATYYPQENSPLRVTRREQPAAAPSQTRREAADAIGAETPTPARTGRESRRGRRQTKSPAERQTIARSPSLQQQSFGTAHVAPVPAQAV